MAAGAEITPLERLKARYGPVAVGARPYRQSQDNPQAAAWQVLLFAAGLTKPVELSVAEARGLAAQLLELADVLEGKRW